MKKVGYISAILCGMRKIITAMLVCVFCSTQLSGCGVADHKATTTSTSDGPPPQHVSVNTSKIRNAIPKVEPYHPYGRRNYVVGGKRYRVLKSSKGYAKRGHASWYGSKFHGRQTSTQDRFNMYGMTAASRELPLPTYVQVTNLRNGKKVVVKVNDRGPFRDEGNRIIDLSYAAAKKLDFVNHGVAPVKVVAINPRTWGKNNNKKTYAKSKVKGVVKKPVAALSEPEEKSKIFLQVGAFSKLDNAKQLSDKVNKIIDKPILIDHKSDLYKVHVGPLASSDQGDELKALLEKKGFDKIDVIDG